MRPRAEPALLVLAALASASGCKTVETTAFTVPKTQYLAEGTCNRSCLSYTDPEASQCLQRCPEARVAPGQSCAEITVPADQVCHEGQHLKVSGRETVTMIVAGVIGLAAIAGFFVGVQTAIYHSH